MKTFVAVVLVCFSFAVNCFGQKIKLKNTELYVKGKLYGFIEPVSRQTIDKNILKNNQRREPYPLPYSNKIQSYAIYSPNKSLIAYIFPLSGQIRLSNKTPLYYSILFDLHGTWSVLQYPQLDSIKTIILDMVNFELITKNTLDRSSLRRLFIKYGKDVKNFSNPFSPNYNDNGVAYNSWGIISNLLIRAINNKEKSITIDKRLIAKYDNIKLGKDSLIVEAEFFDQFNTLKASVTLLNTTEAKNYLFPADENRIKNSKDRLNLNYKFVTNKGEIRFITIPVYFKETIFSPNLTENKTLSPKIRSQLIEIGEYLYNNYYI